MPSNEGGAIGPDLTSLAGRFSVRDLLESLLQPSKEISDQYRAIIAEMDDGQVVTGRPFGRRNYDQHGHA